MIPIVVGNQSTGVAESYNGNNERVPMRKLTPFHDQKESFINLQHTN